MTENGRFGNLAVRTKYSIIAIAVTVLFLAANGPATAACEKGKRIRHNDSECLTASWTNRSWPSLSRVTVRNECPGYQAVSKHRLGTEWRRRPESSFPRKRESRGGGGVLQRRRFPAPPLLDSRFRGNDDSGRRRLAGMGF